MRNNLGAWSERNRIGSGTLLGEKPADVQKCAGSENQAANRPSGRAMYETSRDQPLQYQTTDDWKYEEKWRRNPHARTIFIRWKVDRHYPSSMRKCTGQPRKKAKGAFVSEDALHI